MSAGDGLRWYIVDHDRDDSVVRGPYESASTAGAVRTEMERNPDEERNLWIVPEEPAARASVRVSVPAKEDT